MNLLIDTNIVIPLEPGSFIDVEINTDTAIQLHNFAQRSGNTLCVHPAISYDLSRDSNKNRSALRQRLIGRYKLLPSPPDVSLLSTDVVGNPSVGSNDYVDNCMLAAVKADTVDFLITEDRSIHRKAERIGLHSRVLLLQDAVSLLRDLFDTKPQPPPAVRSCFVHELDERDEIFNSLRRDYGPDFDEWLKKCKREQREAYIIHDVENNRLAGLAILKREDRSPSGRTGKTLKLCTFKVAEHYSGNRYGELLLKAISEYVSMNRYKYMYFTAFPNQENLLTFARSFGFTISADYDSRGEHFVEKSLAYTPKELQALLPLEFHVRYGPRVTSFNKNSTFIVPIIPKYHRLLFPELEQQISLIEAPRPCGNSIKKAYLCHSRITQLRPGDNMLIYRSQDFSSLTAIGVIEDTLRSSETDVVVRYVGSRTVYRYEEIQSLCQKPVLVTKFRFVKKIDTPITLEELRSNGLIQGQPQSISRVPAGKIEWIKARIGM